MLQLNSVTVILALVLSAGIGAIALRPFMNRHTNPMPTTYKYFALIILVGLIALPLACVLGHTSMPSDFMSVFGTGGLFCTTKWPSGITLTTDDEGRITRRVREAKQRAKAKGEPFDLTAAFIAELFLIQGGLCYFSKKLMSWKPNLLETVAITKLDPDQPYVRTNVVLTCNYVSVMKGDRSYETLLKNCQKVVDHHIPVVEREPIQQQHDGQFLVKRQVVDLQSGINEHGPRNTSTAAIRTNGTTTAKSASCSGKANFTKPEREAEGKILSIFGVKRCQTCHEILPQDCFAKRGPSSPSADGLEYRCYVCERKRGLDKHTTKSLITEKVWGCIDRATKKNRLCEITAETVEAQFELQRHRCYYTDDDLTWEPGLDNTASVDRIDSTRSYVEGNIAVCCVVINLMKNDAPVKTFVDYCRAIVQNPLPLDDPVLRTRPNEGFTAKRRQKARDRKSDFDEVIIERIGAGLVGRLSPTYNPRVKWEDHCAPSICERVYSRTIVSTDK